MKDPMFRYSANPLVTRDMKIHTSLLLILFIIAAIGHASSIIPSIEDNLNSFFSCISARGINHTTPYDEEYHRTFNLAAYNLRITNASTKPITIVMPETKEQLATAIICCRKALWAFTFRSGGHSLEGLSYSAGNSSFVMIDLMKLNRVVVDVESKTAWVEGGATIGEVYHAIGTSSNLLGFTAGFGPAVGTGGHIGGGGFGFMSRKYGLSADHVEDAILVDANGKFLDRKSMGEDVFWAIRGGGAGSWGAVYGWKIRLVDVPETVTALRVIRVGPRTEASKLLNKWQWVAPNLEDEFSLMASLIPQTENVILSIFQGLYLGPKSSALASISQAFPELEVVESECKEMKWVETTAFFPDFTGQFTVDDLKNRFATSEQKSYLKWKGDYVRNQISSEGIEGMIDFLLKQPRGQIQLVPYGGIMARIPSDVIPHPHREGILYTIGYLVAWNEDENNKSDTFMDWIHGLHEYMTPFVSKEPRVAYVNEVDLDLGVMDWENDKISANELVEQGRKWGEKYFLANYDRLVQAKTMIDPNNVFRHKQSIPPKALQGSSVGEDMEQHISC